MKPPSVPIVLSIVVAILPFVFACGSAESPRATGPSAAEVVEEVLEALGGRQRWAELESLYIEAIHTQEGLDAPYRSEIWRDIGVPRVRIEQQRAEGPWVRILRDREGWQWRSGETGPIPADELAPLLHWDRHVFYGTIARLAEGDPRLNPRLEGPDRLVLEEDGATFAVFELDAERLPRGYLVPLSGSDGLGRTHYSRWHTTDGYVHPVVSEVPGLGAVYRAVQWVPSREPSSWRYDRSELAPGAAPGGF